MKKIKVYIQRPWRFADSPYYQYLLRDPPKDIEYVGQNQKQGCITNKKKILIIHNAKKSMRTILRNLPFSIPNAHLTISSEKYNLIHCAHCLSLNKKPWIADIEQVNQFLPAGRITKKNKKIIKKILSSKYCKKILPWTKWSSDEILDHFPELKNKIEIVYPGIPSQKFKKIKSDKINLLFISRRFYFKGGLHALEVIDRLTKKYEKVRGIFISNVPKEILKKYSKNKKIKFYGILPHEKLVKEIFPNTDIFVYPSYTDTFGFIITEAMSFGIPVVTVNGQAISEIIEDGKTGFVIDEPKKWDLKDLEKLELKETLKKIEEKVEILIKDKKLRNNMSKAGIREIERGKFSIDKRNKKLARVYEEVLK